MKSLEGDGRGDQGKSLSEVDTGGRTRGDHEIAFPASVLTF